MMNEYIKSIMNRDHEATSEAKYHPNLSTEVITINQSFVLNCFFFKRMYNLLKL